MEQIYLKIKKIVIELSNRFNIDINNYLTKRKTNSNLKKTELPQLGKLNKNHKDNKNGVNDIKNDVNDIKNGVNDFKNDVNDIKNDGTDSKKDIEMNHQPKILELDENMNLNLSKSLSMNIVENITFIKKSETKKENISSINSSKKNKLKKKNSLWKNSTVLIDNKNEDLESNKNIKNSNKSLKFKKLKGNESSSETQINDNSKNNSSLFPNICVTNTTKKINEINSNFSSKIRNKIYNRTYSKYEKILYNSFTNLTTTKEKSFQLSSSYDNINKLSNNKYIKDFNLQAKIKQVLLKECKNENQIKERTSFLKLPGQLQIINNISQSPKSSKNNNNYTFTLFPKEDENFHSYRDNNKSMEFNSDSLSLHDINTKKKSKYLGSSNKLIEIKKNDKFSLTRNYASLKVNRTPNLDSRKLKKSSKKKPGINKQLNKISKIIKNTSNNINNPEEFYKNLFNNIIQKESRSFNEDKEENKTLNFYSSNKVNEGYISDQELEKNIFGSFISSKEKNSNKDSNLNLIKVKTKNKSGFKII